MDEPFLSSRKRFCDGFRSLPYGFFSAKASARHCADGRGTRLQWSPSETYLLACSLLAERQGRCGWHSLVFWYGLCKNPLQMGNIISVEELLFSAIVNDDAKVIFNFRCFTPATTFLVPKESLQKAPPPAQTLGGSSPSLIHFFQKVLISRIDFFGSNGPKGHLGTIL